jgi:uroporphyrinogen-III decarboxylase
MTKAERVRAALAGSEVDRAPFAFWYHFRGTPDRGDEFVRATLDFYRTYDPDLLKVMHDAPYEMPVDKPVLEQPDDWHALPLNPPDSGAFGEQLRALRHIAEYKNDDAPLVDTVPSVFTVAQQITNGRRSKCLPPTGTSS